MLSTHNLQTAAKKQVRMIHYKAVANFSQDTPKKQQNAYK